MQKKKDSTLKSNRSVLTGGCPLTKTPPAPHTIATLPHLTPQKALVDYHFTPLGKKRIHDHNPHYQPPHADLSSSLHLCPTFEFSFSVSLTGNSCF